MKRFSKLFITLLCCVGAMSLTSCLNSDDDSSTIDPETYAYYLNLMGGSYTGINSDYRYQNKIYFYNDTITGNNKTDSIMNITGSVSSRDTTFRISNVPGRVLAKEFPNNYKSIKDAIEERSLGNIITSKFDFFQITQNAYFFPYNTTAVIDNLEYDGETHKITIAFWGGGMYSSGAFGIINGNSVLEITLCMAAVYEDDNNQPLFTFPTSSNEDLSKASLIIRVTR
ncbi:putative uncharacterized protein [Prevotella sp. CAG:1124]|nr:putative uncharacterized protein [Prevotella sp. CAG:1124]